MHLYYYLSLIIFVSFMFRALIKPSFNITNFFTETSM